MKKISLLLVLCLVLAVVFSGCTKDSLTTDEVLENMAKDAAQSEKIMVEINGRELYFEYKNSGLYDNCKWEPPGYFFEIYLDYNLLQNEPWFDSAIFQSYEDIHTEFVLRYCSHLSVQTKENFSLHHKGFIDATCKDPSIETFYEDYCKIKMLENYDFVSSIHVRYWYSQPYFIVE